MRELEITDDKIFERLTESGLDLTQEAMVEAYLYFNSEGAARRVATQLEGSGFTTYADPSPPGRWVVEVVTRIVPTAENVATMGTRMRSTAQSNGGLYDGWWAFEPPEEDPAEAIEPVLPETLPALDFEIAPEVEADATVEAALPSEPDPPEPRPA